MGDLLTWISFKLQQPTLLSSYWSVGSSRSLTCVTSGHRRAQIVYSREEPYLNQDMY